MREKSSFSGRLSGFAAAAIWACILALAPAARAQDAIDPDAASVLEAMSSYLGGLQSFTVRTSADTETVTADGQKLEFASSGEVAVQRPDKLHILRRNPTGEVELVLDGKTMTVYGHKRNAYMQFDAASIDAAVDGLRENIGVDAPGADLLLSKPLDLTVTDVVSGQHVGMTMIDGVEAHHLAFRGNQVDWQLWVKAGDQPLPLKYVITSKWVTAAPEYSLRLTDWNTAPTVDAALFTFKPAEGAEKVESFMVGEAGEVSAEGE